MPNLKLSPYIARDGDAREMMEFYKKVFGGELSLSTFGQSPMPVPDSHKDRIMHSALESGTVSIMASDSTPDMPLSSTHSNISLSLVSKDADKLNQIFDELSDGGKVTMKLEKQFWGDTFGMVDDKFGTHWMVNIDSGQPQGPAPEVQK